MQFQVNPLADNFYAAWRAKTVAAGFLRDEDFPTERLLQAIWQHQRLRRDRLKTADGRSLRIFHPGFASLEGGPDFRGAVLRIGDEPARSGDVEIDLLPSGWHAHSHDRNPQFKNVLLRVVWEIPSTPAPSASPPLLSLCNLLDAPLSELSLSLESESLRTVPRHFRGRCAAALRRLPEADSAALLAEAAAVRFQNKAEQFRVRAAEVGWEQSLWESLFRALGYKHNAWPMQNVAEMKGQWARGARSAFELQARLLGIGNLLPDELTRSEDSTDRYVRRAWDLWWRERDTFADLVLPRSAWRFHGLRPANHPQRRLALASHWLMRKDLLARLEQWVARPGAEKNPGNQKATARSRRRSPDLLESFQEILQVDRDEFWSWHWTFKSRPLTEPQPLLGPARATDLAVNVVLPWLWVRAREGGNQKIQAEVERRYFSWPAAEDNAVLKLARQRLLGSSSLELFRTAARQQGLIQIVRDFCDHSDATCAECRFPGWISGWAESGRTGAKKFGPDQC